MNASASAQVQRVAFAAPRLVGRGLSADGVQMRRMVIVEGGSVPVAPGGPCSNGRARVPVTAADDTTLVGTPIVASTESRELAFVSKAGEPVV